MLYKSVLFLHILGAMLVLGGGILARVVKKALTRQRSVAAQTTLFAVAARVPLLTMPGALLAIGTGSYLTYFLGYGFAQPWVIASYTLWTVSMVCAAGVIAPRLEKAKAIIVAAASAGKTESEEAFAAVNDPAIGIATNIIDVSNLLLLLLMVFRPAI